MAGERLPARFSLRSQFWFRPCSAEASRRRSGPSFAELRSGRQESASNCEALTNAIKRNKFVSKPPQAICKPLGLI